MGNSVRIGDRPAAVTLAGGLLPELQTPCVPLFEV